MSLLHGSSTGMFGYGYARARFKAPGPGSGAYYGLAVAMHASFNALASLAAILMVFRIGGFAVETASFVALVAAIAYAFGAIEHVRSVIHASDYPALTARVRPVNRRAAPAAGGAESALLAAAARASVSWFQSAAPIDR